MSLIQIQYLCKTGSEVTRPYKPEPNCLELATSTVAFH